MKGNNFDLLCLILLILFNKLLGVSNLIYSLFPAYELWFKQILFELDSVRDIFISGHVSHMFLMFSGLLQTEPRNENYFRCC